MNIKETALSKFPNKMFIKRKNRLRGLCLPNACEFQNVGIVSGLTLEHKGMRALSQKRGEESPFKGLNYKFQPESFQI